MVFSLRLFTSFASVQVCFYAQISSFYEDTSHTGLESTLTNLILAYKEPVLK